MPGGLSVLDCGELIDRIIDHLFDDKPAVRSCSLVCKLWVPSSQFHLFAEPPDLEEDAAVNAFRDRVVAPTFKTRLLIQSLRIKFTREVSLFTVAELLQNLPCLRERLVLRNILLPEIQTEPIMKPRVRFKMRCLKIMDKSSSVCPFTVYPHAVARILHLFSEIGELICREPEEFICNEEFLESIGGQSALKTFEQTPPPFPDDIRIRILRLTYITTSTLISKLAESHRDTSC